MIGDIWLFGQSMGWVSKAISRVQRRVGFSEQASMFTHVGIETEDFYILEELGTGIEKTPGTLYSDRPYIILRRTHIDREEISVVAHVLAKHKNKQREYDYLLMTGLWLHSIGIPKWIVPTLDIESRFICTQYVRQVFKQCQYHFLDDDKALYPAWYYELAEKGQLEIVERNLC